MLERLGYKKFCYWINGGNFEKRKSEIHEEGLQPINETRLPCRMLRKSVDLGIILPQAWGGLCKRKTSWYWKSEKAGKLLIVGNHPLDLPGFEERITITESNFKPDRYPTYEETAPLLESMEYHKRKPSEWDNPDVKEKEFYLRCFKRYQNDETFHFNKILHFHSANHANFLDPKYFVSEEDNKAPYSIADSLHTCSSCLEFFNILGDQWPLKYVMPCLGAVQLAHLPQDRYFCVATEKESTIRDKRDGTRPKD